MREFMFQEPIGSNEWCLDILHGDLASQVAQLIKIHKITTPEDLVRELRGCWANSKMLLSTFNSLDFTKEGALVYVLGGSTHYMGGTA